MTVWAQQLQILHGIVTCMIQRDHMVYFIICIDQLGAVFTLPFCARADFFFHARRHMTSIWISQVCFHLVEIVTQFRQLTLQLRIPHTQLFLLATFGMFDMPLRLLVLSKRRFVGKHFARPTLACQVLHDAHFAGSPEFCGIV